MNKVLIATTNKGKFLEFQFILDKVIKDAQFISLNDLENITPPKEVYNTFKENAHLKANFYFNHFKVPVIVDDSGFCVEELDMLPGVHSADWGEGGDFTNAISKIYKMLNGRTSRAFFISIIIYKDYNREEMGEGKIFGEIAKIPLGKNGFGFDSCFIPDGFSKTFGEMSIEEKSSISHRKIALVNLASKL